MMNPHAPTLAELQAMMDRAGGWLDLRGTVITALPDNLTVGGWFDLSGTGGNSYGAKVSRGKIVCGCENHPIAFWRALDDAGAIRMDGKRAAIWWRTWGAELLRWHDAKFAQVSA